MADFPWKFLRRISVRSFCFKGILKIHGILNVCVKHSEKTDDFWFFRKDSLECFGYFLMYVYEVSVDFILVYII